MTTSLAEQLRSARLERGIELEELRQKARLTCTADSLSRKLAGKQILTTVEAESLAKALDVTLVWAPGRARRRAA
jgi:transcriptional regulator with XRE-family HTH domain